jgi:UDP-glucose:(heptosyl)LPS alpha-1,3-glucosyltransferase
MQIALCHENVLPERGGAEMYVADLARRLVTAGHEVHLYACHWNADALPDRLRVHPIPEPAGSRLLRPWRFSAAIQAALERDRPQVSLGFDKSFGTDIYYPLGGLQPASARHNVRKHRSSISRFGARLTKWADPVQWSYSRLERRGLLDPRPPILVVNSAMVRDHAERWYGIDPARVSVIHNAIDPLRFDEADRPRIRAESRRQWGFGPGDIVAAFVAMNYRLKGLEPLLRAAARIPTFRPLKLLIAGSAKTRPWMRLAKRLGIERRVAFVGPCSDIRRIYFAADMHVHPTFYDPCSGVVLEALACGLPVLTSRFNGAAELLPAAAGIVLDDPHDERTFVAKLTELLDPVRRDEMSRAAREASRHWTLEHHYARWLAIFEEVAGARRAA